MVNKGVRGKFVAESVTPNKVPPVAAVHHFIESAAVAFNCVVPPIQIVLGVAVTSVGATADGLTLTVAVAVLLQVVVASVPVTV